jgi:UDPglucose 6-dehydrogenase
MFSLGYQVVVRDNSVAQGEQLESDNNSFVNASKEEINKCDLGVICVPTPMGIDYSCDTSVVEEVVEWLETPQILIKSTIAPGTTDKLSSRTNKNIVFSPEYSGVGSYWSSYSFQKRMEDCPFVILGGKKENCQRVLELFVPILGPEKIYECMPALEAELVKYFENCYFGMKVTFANEMYEICSQLKADYWTVRNGWALDPRIDKMHTVVFPEARGFSGKCFPKDIYALIKASQKAGYEPEFFKEILRSNNRIRSKSGQKIEYQI